MTTEQRAKELIRLLRKEGLTISRVVVEGRKIDVELAQNDAPQKIDSVQW